MLKKNYLLVTVLSFMFISPAFTMTDMDEGSLSAPIDSSREEKVSQVKEGEAQSPSPQQSAEQKTPSGDIKEDSPPSAKPSKKRMGCCCLFRTEDDD